MSSLTYVISTRIRIARNVQDHPFPPHASEEERQALLESVQQAFYEDPCCNECELLLLDRLSPLDRKMLEEKHLISHQLAAHGNARAAILSQAQDISVLINEEDHLRIQAFSPGLALDRTWQTAHSVERRLSDSLQFACSETKGFLAACPQNSGTGIRISAMLFLPGLMLLHRITPIIHACVQDAYTVRGAYGEGSPAEGYLLQLSLKAPENQTIEVSLAQFSGRCRRLIQLERMARMVLLTRSPHLLRKRMRRAEQRKNSRSLSLASALHILAVYRLVVCLGLKLPGFRKAVSKKSKRTRCLQGLDRLSQQMQRAHIRRKHLQYSHDSVSDSETLEETRENELRAELLQQGLRVLASS